MFRHTTFRSFMDLQEENDGVTPGAGWYKNEFLKWTISIVLDLISIGSGITIGTAVLLVEARNQILDLMFKMLEPLPLQPEVNIFQALS
jgi:hypothetical protein